MNFVRSQPGDDPIVVKSYYAASPAKVFKAWTDPELVVKWFGFAPNSLDSASIDLRPGGAWRFRFPGDKESSVGFEGEYLEILADAKLVYSWAHVTEHANGDREVTPSSQVEVTFLSKGSGTDVRLVHTGISTEDARLGVGGGWDSAFSHMADVLEELPG